MVSSHNGFIDPIQLFYDSRKLLAAKISGHNNAYNSVNSMLLKLQKLGFIN